MVGVMDPVSLIVGALAAGGAAGVQDSAGAAVKDAYQALKTAVAGRFAGRPSAQVALAEHAADPDTWAAPLSKAVTETGVADDPQIVAVAERLARLLDEADGRGVSAGEGGFAVGRDVSQRADRGGVVGGVIHGGVNVGNPPPPGPGPA
jgi:hypothetical protein